jgi:hypothetical protein
VQRIQNNVARILRQTPKHFHVVSLLHYLNWFHVDYRIRFKTALLTYAKSMRSRLHTIYVICWRIAAAAYECWAHQTGQQLSFPAFEKRVTESTDDIIFRFWTPPSGRFREFSQKLLLCHMYRCPIVINVFRRLQFIKTRKNHHFSVQTICYRRRITELKPKHKFFWLIR